MKRSDMINLMTDLLHYTSEDALDYEKDSPWCELLLEKMEETGMLKVWEEVSDHG